MKEFHEQVKDLSNKETVDQKAHKHTKSWIASRIHNNSRGTFICTCFFIP